MDAKIVDYARHLTAGDRKTLSQKAFKVSEEIGELAKVLLPHQNAHGTTHRFIDSARILEEACDTVLTAASIAYQLGFEDGGLERGLDPAVPVGGDLTRRGLRLQRRAGRLAEAVIALEDGYGGTAKVSWEAGETVREAFGIAAALGFTNDDLEAMLSRKLVKWADLQAREAGIRYPLPFEVHVTVAEAGVDVFRATCASLGVKPIVLDLHMRDGGTVKDVMTSSVYFGDNPGALAELRRVSGGLRAAGLDVVREKIETVPWHPAAPSRRHANPEMPKDCYFECHLNIVASDDRRALLKVIADGRGAHLSRNIFKRLDGGTFTIMMTHRRYDGVFEDFRAEVDEIRRLLDAACFQVEKEIVEFSVYDTRVSHDAGWLARHAAA